MFNIICKVFDKFDTILYKVFYTIKFYILVPIGAVFLICTFMFVLITKPNLLVEWFVEVIPSTLVCVGYLLLILLTYLLLRFYIIPKLIELYNLKFNRFDIVFNNKTYTVSRKRAKTIQNALSGDRRSQYELITEFYEPDNKTYFIPEICFYFTKLIAEEDTDLGVIVELGDLYKDGIGVRKNKNKALETYNHALSLYDNQAPNLYIPDNEYRQFLIDLINSIRIK